MAEQRRKKVVRMWAGFESGRIYREDFNTVRDVYGNIPSYPIILFSSKRDARARFEDVRLVEVREVKRGTHD